MTARPRAVIIGMMGAGKTRVGKEVAHMLRLPFADADVEIEREVGMKIPSYFEEYGEPAFREVEADLIADMLEDFDGIFSLGGGAPMTPSTQPATSTMAVVWSTLMPIRRKPWNARTVGEAGPCSMATPTPVGKNCSSSVTQYSARSPTFMSIPGGLRLRAQRRK